MQTLYDANMSRRHTYRLGCHTGDRSSHAGTCRSNRNRTECKCHYSNMAMNYNLKNRTNIHMKGVGYEGVSN